ncbi:MAG: phage holin family protein [Novosphingobium sp.]|uniref:phage holin family protein n=1 Tax=Novosphingobium sp. TaxID=1874826 RepID=UPI003C7E078C
MDAESPPLVADPSADPAQRSLIDDLRQMLDDGRTLVEAELAYQKSRAAVAGAGAKGIVGWALLALALVFFTLMAVVVGALLILSAWLGPIKATGITVLALLGLTAAAALAAHRRWERIARLLADQDPVQ